MRKISIAFFILILMMSLVLVKSYASEENTEVPEQVNTENIEGNITSQEDYSVETIGKVIEASEPVDNQVGNITERTQEVKIEIIEGDYIGEEFTTTYVLSYDVSLNLMSFELEEGDKVTVEIIEDVNGNVTANIQDIARANYIIVLFLLFLLSIFIIGGKQGIKTVASIILTLVIIYLVLIKGTFNGKNAIWRVFLTSFLAILITYIITSGFNKKVITAAVGTMGGVICAGIIALIFNNLAKMTGASGDAMQLSINLADIKFNFRDILFAGIVISSLGACMDIGMTIATELGEIRKNNVDITWKELFFEGMNIGRESMRTMTNTLILAYVGNSLTLILLYMANNMSFIDILNREIIAEYIASALAGSMGVVYTVPITSFIYSFFNKDKLIYKKESENRINGKRSLKI